MAARDAREIPQRIILELLSRLRHLLPVGGLAVPILGLFEANPRRYV